MFKTIYDLETNQTQASLATEREVDALNSRAWGHRRSQIAEARRLAEQAYANAIHYPHGKVDSLITQSHILSDQGDYETALELASEAYRIAADLRYHRAIAHAANQIGVIDWYMGEFEAAHRLANDTLALFIEQDDELGQSYVHNLLGVTLSAVEDYEQAVPHYEQAHAIAERYQNTVLQVTTLNNLGVTCFQQNAWADAESYFQQAFDVATARDNNFGLAMSVHNMAVNYYHQLEPQKAIRFLLDNTALMERENLTGMLPSSLHWLGKSYHAMGDTENAKVYYQKALDTGIQRRMVMMDCHYDFARLYKEMGDYEGALHQWEAYDELRRSLQLEKSEVAIKTYSIREQIEHVRLEAERQKALRQQDQRTFEDLSRMKDEYVNTATHDLKNPLAIMTTKIHLLRHHVSANDAEAQNILQTIDQQIQRMRALITNLLTLAQSEDIALQMQPVLVNEFVRGQLQNFRGSQPAIQFLPLKTERTIHGDPSQLQHVLDNLLSNALRHTPSYGDINVLLSTDDSHLILRVQDTGTGIMPEDLRRIFDKFYRVPRNESGGTGLGLAIVKAVVERHNGTVSVDSTPGKGSTFTVKLPLAE